MLVGGEKILPVAAVYGANASGKSNIYNAFEYMTHYVVDSFKYGGEEEKFEEFRPTPFLFDSISADEMCIRDRLKERIIEECNKAEIIVDISDQKEKGRPIRVSFKGDLRMQQELAA